MTGAPRTATVARIEIFPREPLFLPTEDSVGLTALTFDSTGRQVRLAPATLRWLSRTPAVAESRGAGLITSGATVGEAWVLAEAGEARDSVRLHTFQRVGEFHITLILAPDVPARARTLLAKAARRWEAVIGGELPPVALNTPGGDCPTNRAEPPSPPQSGIERGTRIYVHMSIGFPPEPFVHGLGSPCLQRPLPRPTTILGQVILNRAADFDAVSDWFINYLMVHEMGHALGMVGLVNGDQPSWYDVRTRTYTGAMALEGYRRETGIATSALTEQGGHWVFREVWDVMGGGAGALPNPMLLSSVTIGGLLDLGYPARWSGGGPAW
jgi:hypothetical protein